MENRVTQKNYANTHRVLMTTLSNKHYSAHHQATEKQKDQRTPGNMITRYKA